MATTLIENMSKVAVVLPAYNEEQTIAATIEDFYQALPNAAVIIHHHLSASFNKLKQQDWQKLLEDNKKIYEAKWGPWAPHEYR